MIKQGGRQIFRDASSIGGIKHKYEVTETKKACRREHAPLVRPGGLTTRWLVMWAHGLENAAFPDPERPDKSVQFFKAGLWVSYKKSTSLGEAKQIMDLLQGLYIRPNFLKGSEFGPKGKIGSE